LYLNRRILLFWVVFLVSLSSFCQNEPANWFFGNKAGINFSTNPATTQNVNGFYASEGSSAISSPAGKLLFYTDGENVYSADNTRMPNGAKLLGAPNATQSSIIVPKPNSSNQYFVFTLDAGGGKNGLTYSEVDMTLNRGLGDVTSVKNVSLKSPLAEKLTAIRHNNGTDYWVLVHGIDNTNKKRFFAYKVTASGPASTPVTSEVGSSHNVGFGSALGYMKFSPNGEKVACVVGGSTNSFVEIFDFDDKTGEVTNPMRVDYTTVAYGLEFSPDSKRLYVSSGSKIFQYILPQTQNTGFLVASQKEITADANVWALQLSINHKIYACKQGGKIGVINSPNNDASTANFVDNSFVLESGTVAIQGLPNFMPHYFNDNFITAENLCAGNSTRFSVLLNGLDSVVWDFGDAVNGGTQNFVKGFTPAYSYKSVGSYVVSATIYNKGYSTIISRKIDINPLPSFSLGNDTILCKGQVLNLKINIPNATYLWNDGNSASGRTITTPGIHFVDVSLAGCTARDSVKLSFDLVKPDFEVNKSSQCLSGNSFKFSTSATGIKTSQWICNDTVIGTTPTLIKSFTDPSIYNIVHVVKSDNNCIDSANTEIKVYNNIQADFDIVVNNGCGPANNFDFVDKTSYAGVYDAAYEIDGRTITKNTLNWNFSSGPGTYDVTYKVISTEGCSHQITKSIIVYQIPNAAFEIVSQKSCLNDNVIKLKKLTPLNPSESITWFVNSQKVDGDETMQVSLPVAGRHLIQAKVTNPSGCVTVFEQDFEIFQSPLADFTTSQKTLGCLGNKNIQFEDISKSNTTIKSYAWDFGDNTTSTLQNPVKDYAQQSDYLVSLTVTNDKGCSSTQTQTLSTFEKPDTRISASIISPCFDDNAFVVSFKNINPLAKISSYYWEDEKGKIYNANPLPISFDNPGKHLLKLIVSTSNGCQDSGYTTFNVYSNPTGEIVYNKTVGCMGEDFEFKSLLTGQTSPVSKYTWNLGNGNTANGPAVITNYKTDGDFSVNLKVEDQYGCKSEFEPVDIKVLKMPVFTINSQSTCINEPLKMEIEGLDKFSPVSNWVWNFGDGKTSTKPIPTHVYRTPGTYKVSASVTSDMGCTYKAVNNAAVVVNELPSVNFEYNKAQWGFDETVVDFNAITSGDVVNYVWDFGNGKTSTQPKNEIRYDVAGYFNVSLTITNNKGCVNSIKKDILVVPPFDAYVPTAFTPNGDGKNDYFGMEGVEFIKTFKMQIINRWGQQIFVTNNVDVKWDGRSNNAPMPCDVYSYVITLTDAEDRPYSLSGTLELIR
jgi:gliding motility-associated-like protein